MLGVLGPVSVVGHDHAACAGGDDLVAVERQHAVVPERAAFLPVVHRAERLGRILDEQNAVRITQARLAIAEATYVRAPKTLHGSVLTPEQSNAIMNGKSMEYERENPNDKSQVFVLKARYSPIYYTIRSESVLDKDGKPLVRSVSVSEEPSQTLQSVEEAVKMSAQKTKKRVSQQRQM